MNKLLSLLSVDQRAEGKHVRRRKRASTVSKGFQKALLLHFDKYYVRIPRTPVPYLFKTNDVPSTEDLANMRAYIQQLQQITISTETSPSSIKRYKGNRAYGIAIEHTRLLQQTTIRNLPPEIIQQIVHFSLSPSPTLVREDCLPWVASWVCSSWRRTVLAQHHLWGTLPPIRLELSFVKPERKRKAFLQELLRRSGDASLTLSISITFAGFIHRDDYDHTLLDLLLEHSHRYVDLRLDLNDHVLSSIIMPTSSRWRRLRHLSLEINWFHQNIYPSLPFDLRQITSLRSIDIPSNIWSQFLLPSHMETATLCSMGVTSLSPEDLVLTLDPLTTNLASSVTKLVLPACIHGRSLGDDFSPVFAPQVTEIVLYDPSSSWSTGGLKILECFVTPCLHTLKISFPSTLTIDRLASRLSEATSLTTLHLLCRPDSVPTQSPDDVRLSMSTLTTLIESTPNVVDFKIFDDTSSYSFIHFMAYLKKPRKDWDSYPLPRLKHLTIFVRWDIPPRVLDLLHYVAISRMERPPPFGDSHFARLETLEVVLNHADDFMHTRPANTPSRTVKRSGEGRPLAPHAAQDFVRGVMEGWSDFRGLGRPTSHLSPVGVAEEIRDLHRRLARLSQSVDEPPFKVFADMERCLESLLDGLGADASLNFGPIEHVYLSGAYWELCDLKNALESGRGWRMPGFSMLHHTSVELAARILGDWEPRLAELTTRTRWFNLGVDSLLFLRLDDPRRLENETKECLVNGFPLLNHGCQRSDLVLPRLPSFDKIRMEL